VSVAVRAGIIYLAIFLRLARAKRGKGPNEPGLRQLKAGGSEAGGWSG
jgi:hypothetical protein